MKRLTHLSFVASLALLVVGSSLLSGCPAGADLEDTGDTGGTGGGVGPSCDVSVIFEESCSSSFCHSGPTASGGVDLLSPGVEARVYNQPGTYPGSAASCAPAVPELLVDPTNIDASLIVTKITGQQLCGETMPAGLLLPDDQIECIRNWVAGIIANPPAGTGTNTGTGGLPGTGGDGTGGSEQNPVGGTGGLSGTGATGVGGSGESGGSGGGTL